MARPDKAAVVDRVREDLEGTVATVLTEYRGLTVSHMAELRTKLRGTGARYKVAKNTLIRIAAKQAGFDVPDEALSGPTALAYVGEDIAGAAKALKAFAKDHPQLIIKGAVLDGTFLDADQAEKLADLETRDELLGSFLGMFETMLGTTTYMLDDMLSETAGLMEALEAKKSAA